MDITMIGLQNAGKTSLLRVLAVSSNSTHLFFPRRTFYFGGNADDDVNVQGGEFTLEYDDSFPSHPKQDTCTFLSRPSFHRSGGSHIRRPHVAQPLQADHILLALIAPFLPLVLI